MDLSEWPLTPQKRRSSFVFILRLLHLLAYILVGMGHSLQRGVVYLRVQTRDSKLRQTARLYHFRA
jgi:hypothetical protein